MASKIAQKVDLGVLVEEIQEERKEGMWGLAVVGGSRWVGR